MRSVSTAVLAVLCVLAPCVAVAQVDREEEAHSLFEAGRLAYSAGHFADARDDFERAYDLSGRPELLYNIGQCADRLRDDAAAIDAFERYLGAVQEPANGEEVLRRLVALRAARAVDVPIEHPSDSALALPRQPVDGGGDETALWVGVGVGAGVAVVLAIVIGVLLSAPSSSVESPIPGAIGPGGIVIALGGV
jgi:hypothetical protein